MIEDIFGILVIVSLNVIDHVILESIWIGLDLNCRWKKKLADKLVQVCAETVEEVKMSIKTNVVLAHCTLCCFQYSLQSKLELVLILFTINT